MTEALNSIAMSWWSWMSAMFWQVTILVLLVLLIDSFLGKRLFPQLRYAIWLLVLVKLIIPPDFSLPTGLFSSVDPLISPHIELASSTKNIEVKAGSSARVENAGDVNDSEPAVGNQANANTELNPAVYVFIFWFLGVLIFIGLLISRIMMMVGWQKDEAIPKWYHNTLRAAARRLKLNYIPSIVFSEEIPTPAVYGLFRPVLVLPREYAEELTRRELFYMTLHELSHLKRKDLWAHALAVLLQCIYWFNPFIYLVQAKLKQTREVCCDLTVSNALKGENKPYRSTLINAARRWLTRKPSPALGFLGVFEEPHQIINRISWLEKNMTDIRPLATISVVAIIAVAAIFILPMSGSSNMIDLNTITNQDGLYAKELSQGKCLHMITDTRQDVIAMGLVTKSSPRGSEEVWMDNNRVAIIQDKVKVIADLEKNELIYMNRMSQTYLVTKMPVDENAIYDDHLKKHFGGLRYEVELENTGKKKEILGRKCDVWFMKRTVFNSLGQSWGGKLEIWIDPNVKIDYRPFEVAMDNIRRISGGDAVSRKKLNQMKGFQHRIDYNADSGLFATKLVSELKLFEFAEPPAGVFSIPEGFTAKEKLSQTDLY